MLHFANQTPTSDQALTAFAHALYADEPAEIREKAAQLVASGHTQEARTLIEQGLEQHPRSEHLLVMQALLCEMQQRWPEADRALEQLIDVQGAKAPAESWAHWARVLRCRAQFARALSAAERGLQLHPNDAVLHSECDTLQAMARAGVFERTAAGHTLPQAHRKTA